MCPLQLTSLAICQKSVIPVFERWSVSRAIEQNMWGGMLYIACDNYKPIHCTKLVR